MTGPAPFILAIDVEPAPRYELRGDPAEWDGFGQCVEHLARWRDRILTRTGRPLRVTWFVRCDPQMSAYGSDGWALDYFARRIDELRAQGDDFGLHVHPYHRTAQGAWRQDWTNEERICEMVAAAAPMYKTALGGLRYFRMGDGWLSDRVVALLEALGVEYDLTVEPGFPSTPCLAPDVGRTADFRRAPRFPYRPSRASFLTPDETAGRNLRIVPVSTGCVGHPHLFHPADAAHRIEKLHLAFDPAFVRAFIDFTLTSGRFTMAVARTGDVSWSKHLFGNFDYLLGHPDLVEVAIEPPPDAVERQARLTASPPR